MASRLELIGLSQLHSGTVLWLIYAERDKHLRKSKDDNQQSEKVDSFRGVSFENWLRLFMQVG